jgi:hypothetical protein
VLYPEFADYYEPLKNLVPERNGPHMLAEYWENEGFWEKKTKPRHEGLTFFRMPKRHSDGMGKVHITMEYTKSFPITDFLIDASKQLSADFAVVLVDTISVKNQKDRAYQYHHSQQISGPIIRTFKEPMNDLGWAQYMSNRFIEAFFKNDAEKVSNFTSKQLGFYKVEQCLEGVFWQLTENPMDVETDLDGFIELREQAKAIIGAEYFIDINRPPASANFANSFVGVAVDDNKIRAEAILKVRETKDEMPDWEKVLRENISDPIRLEEAIRLTDKALSMPMPNIDLEPEKHAEETKKRAAFLREMIFPTDSGKTDKPFSIKNLFKLKSNKK